MDTLALDPYEQQLLTVFDSYDHDNLGSLDMDGLTQLCQTLQLEEQGSELVRCLLKDPKHSRATFTEFKDALLALLGNMQNNKQNHHHHNHKSAAGDDPMSNKIETGSPDREVSPKYVYGSKKYGRRSRPRSEDFTNNTTTVDEQNDLNYMNTTKSAVVQRSNSQSEVSNSKKRRTNCKLKRCTSLPGGQRSNNFITSNTLTCETDIWTEEMLREAWRKLGVGTDGFLNQTELVVVCDAIGLHKLADGVIRQLSNKMGMDFDRRISFQELLEALQQDETWTEVLEGDATLTDSTNTSIETIALTSLTTTTTTNSEVFPDSRTFRYVTLGPDGSGIITADTLIEMWEMVGITAPKELIHELGFDNRDIPVAELAAVLEREIKGLNESSRVEMQNPHLALLQANLTLYQSEIRCLKMVLEQMHAEREKLKCDVADANNRAKLLAQEVDDNHVRMERNAQNQVKLLEQRHVDILKQVTQQCTNDKEQLALVNQSLEAKICALENEAAKLKGDLAVAQKYSGAAEKENQVLMGRIAEQQQTKVSLADQIAALELEKQRYVEMEQEQFEPLLAQLSDLHLENAQLRDKNDEMVAEIEVLTGQVQALRTKVAATATPSNHHYSQHQQQQHLLASSSNNTLDRSMEEGGLASSAGATGAKRRSDYSPTKDVILFGIADGSPRLGKVRKFQDKDSNLEAVPFVSNESGFETEIDCFDRSPSPCQVDGATSSGSSNGQSTADEVLRLRSKIAFLEQVLVQNSIPVPAEEGPVQSENADLATVSKEGDLERLRRRSEVLERILQELIDIGEMFDKSDFAGEELMIVKQRLQKLVINGRSLVQSARPLAEACVQTETSDKGMESLLKTLEEENGQLKTKCEELENCVELLRTEYEKCEDYWQSKLDEERQFFEAEQGQSNDKLADLFAKMQEYEEQFGNQDAPDGRLPTIEETYNLEKQFTDLEQEYEDFRALSENEMFKRDEEISVLKQKLTELALDRAEDQGACRMCDVTTQCDETPSVMEESARIHDRMGNLSLCMVETTNLFSADALPPTWASPVHQSSVEKPPAPLAPPRDYVNSTFVWQKDSQSPSSGQASSSSASSALDKQGSTPCRPKRTRKHERNNFLYNKKAQESAGNGTSSKEGSVNGSENSYRCGGGGGVQEQMVALPVSAVQSINGRLHHLEQRCRQLQMVLKQQHFYTEQSLQQCKQHHRGEKAELHCIMRNQQERLDQQIRVCNEQLERLTRSDMLVKELYVENSYLIAKVQRLEQQCHILAQCNANSSSV